jgi:hypothetical protein
MDLYDRIEELLPWVFAEHNREMNKCLKELQKLAYVDFKEYFPDVLRLRISPRIKKLKEEFKVVDGDHQVKKTQWSQEDVKRVEGLIESTKQEVTSILVEMVECVKAQDTLAFKEAC